MPLLDDQMLLAMRSEVKHCPECTMQILKNYCRQCDEFFEYGHIDECRDNPHQHEKHKEHRTY